MRLHFAQKHNNLRARSVLYIHEIPFQFGVYVYVCLRRTVFVRKRNLIDIYKRYARMLKLCVLGFIDFFFKQT